MTRNEFNEKLCARLSGMSQSDIDKTLEYYGEMLDEHIEAGESEEEAIASLGTIDEIFESVASEASLPKLLCERVRPKRRLAWWEIALINIGFPIWGPIAIAVICAVVSIYVGIWACVISIYAVSLACVATGIAGIAFAVPFCTSGRIPQGIASFSMGLFSLGIGIFVFLGANCIAKWLCIGTKKAVLAAKYALVGKERK